LLPTTFDQGAANGTDSQEAGVAPADAPARVPPVHPAALRLDGPFKDAGGAYWLVTVLTADRLQPLRLDLAALVQHRDQLNGAIDQGKRVHDVVHVQAIPATEIPQ